MVEAHEHHEKAHEAAHHGDNKGIAILITVLAALLAITEMGGKSAQNTYMATHIEAANLWSFYQAKTIRLTMLKATAEAIDAIGPEELPNAQVVAKQLQRWRQTGDRYESEPETGEGRKELSARAKATEARRDRALAAYHLFEYGSAGFQLAIVLASASVITGVVALAWIAGALGAAGLALNLLGWFAPTLVHL